MSTAKPVEASAHKWDAALDTAIARANLVGEIHARLGSDYEREAEVLGEILLGVILKFRASMLSGEVLSTDAEKEAYLTKIYVAGRQAILDSSRETLDLLQLAHGRRRSED